MLIKIQCSTCTCTENVIGSAMAAAFKQNKSKIQAVLEHNLTVIVPKLHSVSLISDQDRDLALDSSVDGSTRAAILINAIERKIINYRTWWILVYVLLSSGLDADKSFFESLVVSPELHDVHERPTQASGRHPVRFVVHHEGGPSYPASLPPQAVDLSNLFSSKDEAIGASSSTPSALSESEPVLTQEESAIDTSVVEGDSEEIQSSVWYTHAIKYPGIKFSNYYTRQTVTHRGDIIKGEGIEVQIPGRAIKRGQCIEFTIQGCIDGPLELPEDVSFASPVFVITPHYQFEREVTLWGDIYVNLQSYEDCKELVFLTSPSEPTIDDDGPHWNFQISENEPQCNVRNRKVWIQMKQFCLFCFGIRRRVPQYQYRVSLHSPLTSVNELCRAVFSVSLYHEVFIKNLRVYLESFRHEFHETCHTPQRLTHKEIELCLPKVVTTEGYEIVADRKPCIILKSDVDVPCLSWRYKRRAKRDKEGYPPRIILTVTYTKSLQQATNCELRILGVSDKLKAFNMTIPQSCKQTTYRQLPRTCVMSYAGTTSTPLASKGNIYRGHHRDNLTMNKLLHLPLSTFLEFVNIPREIGNHLSRLRAALSSKLFVSIWSTDNVCAPHQDQECDIDDHNMYELDAEQINQHFLQEWISGRFPSYLEASWISLAYALDECEIGNRELDRSLRKYRGPLTMDTLLNFPVSKVKTVNIPREVGRKYFRFGTHLLQEVTQSGTHIRTLELKLSGDGELINEHILQEWLNGEGRPVTWATLVEVLNIIEKGELAKEIEEKYINPKAAAINTL